jgi:hypothetical protein
MTHPMVERQKRTRNSTQLGIFHPQVFSCGHNPSFVSEANVHVVNIASRLLLQPDYHYFGDVGEQSFIVGIEDNVNVYARHFRSLLGLIFHFDWLLNEGQESI